MSRSVLATLFLLFAVALCAAVGCYGTFETPATDDLPRSHSKPQWRRTAIGWERSDLWARKPPIDAELPVACIIHPAIVGSLELLLCLGILSAAIRAPVGPATDGANDRRPE